MSLFAEQILKGERRSLSLYRVNHKYQNMKKFLPNVFMNAALNMITVHKQSEQTEERLTKPETQTNAQSGRTSERTTG